MRYTQSNTKALVSLEIDLDEHATQKTLFIASKQGEEAVRVIRRYAVYA